MSLPLSQLLGLALYSALGSVGQLPESPRHLHAQDEFRQQSCAYPSIELSIEGASLSALPATHPVLLRFIDAATKRPISVRAGVFDAYGVPVPPFSQELYAYQSFGWRSYFYSDSIAGVYVATGPTTIRAGRGFEYLAVDSTLTINSDTTVTIELQRFIDMKSYGWYSGDTHVHLTHPPLIYTLGAWNLKMMAHGEDLNFVNSMEEDQSFFTGDIDANSSAEHILYFSKEQRNADFSHMAVLGLKQWIPGMGCGDSTTACGRTLDGLIYDMIHAQGPDLAVIAAHPLSTTDVSDVDPWPGGGMWRAMPLDLVGADVDAMDLLSYSNMGVQSAVAYYEQALNAGFRLPPSAGTDAAVGRGNTLPPGGYRVYVMPPEGSGFTFASWVGGFRAGRSFVSNYPLFTEFTIEGAMAGDVIEHDGGLLQGTVTVWCQLPLDTLQIIANGEVIHTSLPDPDSLSFSTSFTVDPSQMTWVVARVKGGSGFWHPVPAPGLFAQTAPIYLQFTPSYRVLTHEPPSTPAGCVEAGAFFVDMLGAIQSIFEANGNFPENSEAAFDSAVAGAVDYFSNLHQGPPTAIGPDEAPSGREWWLASPHPNPFQASVRIEYAAPPGVRDLGVGVYDAAGRLVRRLPRGNGDGYRFETVWDGRDTRGEPAASGVYFVRLDSPGAPSRTRKVVLVR